jgi:tetratricopeptide (TPR) repeat protein
VFPTRAIPLLLLGLLLAAALAQGGVAPEIAGILGIACGLLALVAAGARTLRPAPGDALVLVSMWSALAGVQVLWSAAPDAALDGASGALAALLVFLIALVAVPDGERSRLVNGLAFAGMAVACVALLLGRPDARAHLPFGNPNHLAGWLLLPGSIAFAGMLSASDRAGSRPSIVGWFGVLTMIGAAIALAGSRGAALAAAVAAAAVVVLRNTRPRQGPGLVTAGFFSAALALAVLPAFNPDLVPASGPAGESSAGLRWQVYGGAAHAALDAAPHGTGLGSFASAFAAHRPANLPYTPRFAHGEFLHGLVELGIWFLAGLGVTVALVLRRAVRARRAERTLAAMGGTVALLAVAAHALIEFTLHIPAIALTTALLAGVAFDVAPTKAWRSEGIGATRAALAGLGAMLLFLAGSQVLALDAERRANSHLVAGDFGAAEAVARRGLRVRPQRVALHALVARAAEHAYRLAGGGPASLARAIEARRAATRANPRDAETHLALARILRRSGDSAGALASADRAIALDPMAPAPYLARAGILLAAAREMEAARSVRDAIERHPPVAYDAVGALLSATDDPSLAGSAVPATPRTLLAAGRALHRAGFPRSAADEFQRALALRPGDAVAAIGAARSWREAGRLDRGLEVLEETLELIPDDPRVLRERDGMTRALQRRARRGRAS